MAEILFEIIFSQIWIKNVHAKPRNRWKNLAEQKRALSRICVHQRQKVTTL